MDLPPNDFPLPRLGDDKPEDRPQRKWEELFYPKRAPSRPAAFDLLLTQVDHHKKFMKSAVPESLQWDDAKRQMIAAKVKIDGLHQAALKLMIARPSEGAALHMDQQTAAQDRQIEQNRIEQEARVAAAKERSRLRQERAELDRAGRESMESEVESEQDRASDRLGAAMAKELRKHSGQVVPLRRERRAEDREGPVEEGEKRAPPRIVIDLITDEELYAKHFDPLVFLVKDMLAEGTLNILAGKPKIGKSFLALQIGRMVGAGLELWPGYPCTEAPVLYLGLEDTQRRLKNRMIGQLGMGVRPLGGVRFATLWPRVGIEGEDGIAAIEQVVAEFGIRLVIIDTWARFRALSGNGRGGTAYIQDYDDLAPLVDFCKRTGVAILLIHHTKKGESANIFDMISGSVGLQGAVDCEMVLTGEQIKESEGGGRAVLSGSARDFEGFEHELEFEPVPCLWKYVGKAAVVRVAGEKEAVLSALRELGGEASSSAVRGIIGKSVGATRLMLNRMVQDRLLERVRPGVFRVKE